jgi:lipopolysaccharide/colanic/teichoic acid biosynthesis glycosyltransferase
MLVLGRKYKFTELELSRLHKKFDTIKTIRYTNRNPQEVMAELEHAMNTTQHKILVLNTKASVDDSIVKYLTNLQFNNQITIISIESFVEEYLHKCYIPEEFSELHFLNDIRPFTPFQSFQKRALDYIAIFLLYLFTFPILFYARRRIKKESPGTSMYKQLRVGKNNQEFWCNKFRSMSLDAEKHGAQFASANDTRVFPFGEFMRKTRIDELPQMLNVLKGEMHFVGPRPERKFWIEQFEKDIPYYNERHLVAPGITGWAQVMYPYGANVEDAKQKLMYDLYYIKHWSLWLEIKVLIKTVQVVLGKKGV